MNDIDKEKEYLYLFVTKSGLYYSVCKVPSREKTLVTDYFEWYYGTTLCTNFDLIGFMTRIDNSDIEQTINISKVAEKYDVDISKIDICHFVYTFKNCTDYYRQVERYIKYIRDSKNNDIK